ncbi:MAG: F0F1 ATP synthase subunit delta [Patescibacteria group bacterium]
MSLQIFDLSPMQKYLHTTNDARQMQTALQRMSEKMFTTGSITTEVLQQTLPYELATFVTRLMQEHKVTGKDRVQLQSFLTSLTNAVNNLPVVALTLARPPQVTFLQNVQEWFLRSYNTLVLLDIAIDASLIAGGVISIKGKYYDYSLKTLLDSTQKPVEKK